MPTTTPWPRSFFATLVREVLNRRRFKTRAEARMAIFEWLEGWYNPHRRHSALGYLSPINYERKLPIKETAEFMKLPVHGSGASSLGLLHCFLSLPCKDPGSTLLQF